MIDRQTENKQKKHVAIKGHYHHGKCKKKKKKGRKNNMLSDTMAYSVHGLDGWQKSKIFRGEEAIKSKQGAWACEG